MCAITRNRTSIQAKSHANRSCGADSQIFVIDGEEDRLELANQIGATTFNTKDGNVGDQIRELTGGLGADCGAECVGYQCHNLRGKEVPNLVMNSLVEAVKATGTLGIIGVYVPEDPHARDKLAKVGQIAFDFWKLVQRPAHGDGPMQREGLQPAAHGLDPSWQGLPLDDHLA
jgi:threonine dehydrogenase-like Zn-dependent dehydrogenase